MIVLQSNTTVLQKTGSAKR